MYNNRKIIGFTGPSIFSADVKLMIEKYFNAIPLYINSYKKEDLEWVASQIDALVLGGGNDIYPGTLGLPVTRDDNYTKFDRARDLTELNLIDLMIKKDAGILALCRGFQILGVKFGFHLLPDISYGNILHGMAGDIKVNLEAGELNHSIECLPQFKKKWFDSIYVNSYHHQSLYFDKNNPSVNGCNVIAIADIDTNEKRNTKIIEIFENPARKMVACQFHAELYDRSEEDLASRMILERFKEFIG